MNFDIEKLNTDGHALRWLRLETKWYFPVVKLIERFALVGYIQGTKMKLRLRARFLRKGLCLEKIKFIIFIIKLEDYFIFLNLICEYIHELLRPAEMSATLEWYPAKFVFVCSGYGWEKTYILR